MRFPLFGIDPAFAANNSVANCLFFQLSSLPLPLIDWGCGILLRWLFPQMLAVGFRFDVFNELNDLI